MKLLLCLVVLLASARPALAADDLAGAREHYERGRRAYNTGHFDEAAREYEAAYRLKDDPALLYNLGQAHRLAGHAVEALNAYKAFLRDVSETPYRAEVEQRIVELQQKIEAEKRAAATPSSVPPAASSAPQGATPAGVLVERAPPPKRSRAWIWGVAAGGAVVVAGAIVLGVVLGAPQNPKPSLGVAGAQGF